MTTLFVDRKGLTLRADGGALAFYQDGERMGTVPIKLLERVCIRGDVQLSASVLGKLGEEGAGVVVLNGRKRRPVLLMPSLRVDARRRAAQFQLARDADFCLRQARGWVGEKISAQAVLLDALAGKSDVARARLHQPRVFLAELAQQVAEAADLAQLRGLEGAAAACYFAALSCVLPDSLQFSGRKRRPPTDPFNAVLSLGYTLVHFELVRQVYLTGLDPFVGFYHTLEHGRESLACDLIEPLRPLYDEWAMTLFADKVLRTEDFSMRGGACEIGKAGRMRFYSAFETVAKAWRPQMRRLCADLLFALGVASGEGAECFSIGEMRILGEQDALADCL